MAEEGFQRIHVIGFAGHRKVSDSAAIKAALLTVLRDWRGSLPGTCVGRASTAAGADMLFLESCRELGIPFSVVLPFPEERFAEDFADCPADWDRAKALMAAAASVEIVPGNEGVPEAYHLAAREILDTSDRMLFVWDGEAARGVGGTAESVTEARERRLPLQIIHSATAAVSPLENEKSKLPGWDDFTGLPAAGTVADLFEKLDRRASGAAPRSRWFSAGSITLNQLATVTSAVLVAFWQSDQAAPAVKFIIVLFAGSLPWLGARFRINETWREDRLLAELLRSLMASHSFAPPFRSFAADLFEEDAAFLRAAAWRLIPQRQKWNAARESYLRERLDGQIEYLKRQGQLATKRLRIFRIVFRIASMGALILGAIAIIAGIQGHKVAEGSGSFWLVFLPTMLPAVAAWCLAMIPLFEHQRRARAYRRMAEQLGDKKTELLEAKCFTTAATVVGACERLLLAELWEWAGTRGKRKR